MAVAEAALNQLRGRAELGMRVPWAWGAPAWMLSSLTWTTAAVCYLVSPCPPSPAPAPDPHSTRPESGHAGVSEQGDRVLACVLTDGRGRKSAPGGPRIWRPGRSAMAPCQEPMGV